MAKNKNVVVMGGGSGIFPVITALQDLPVSISTIITVADSGGSTGRIRDEFGFQAVGDLRQSLAALANKPSQNWIRKILLYRFAKGNGLKGHNLGNLILTALQDMTNSTTKALEIAETVFDLEGSVIPVTEQVVDLKITYQNGLTQVGEHVLDEVLSTTNPIKSVSTIPSCDLNPKAISALNQADLIIIGPGDLYASIMATLSPNDTAQVFSKLKAKTVYMVNLMTKATQTSNMTAQDHLTVVEEKIEKKIDFVVLNSEPIPSELLKKYAAYNEEPVIDDLPTKDTVIRADVLHSELHNQNSADAVERSVLRHDSQKVSKVLKNILKKL